MNFLSRASWVSSATCLAWLIVGCTESSDDPQSGRGGGSSSGGSGVAGASGTTNKGGTSSASGGTTAAGGKGGASNDGSGGNAGASTTGGSAGGGNAGAAGSDGTSKRPVQKSAGCGKTGYSKTVAQTISTKGGTGNYLVSLPASYDPNKAYPLGFGFHGYGRTHTQCRDDDCLGFQDVMQNDAILIYMKSFTDGWENAGTVRDNNAQFFADVLAKMKTEYCVDEERVFAAGTSSGAAFAAILACRYGDQLVAAVPVAGSMEEKDNCKGAVPSLVIHGIADKENNISGGREVRDFYIKANGCTNTSVPPVTEVDKRVLADREAKKEGYECADYQGCKPGFPVRWCVHSEGGYDDVNHGWPTFGGKEIWAFVQKL
jgi:poly(3-hydroxybutyrate) depolymerase